MQTVRYRGRSDVRIITSATFTAAGLSSPTVTWQKSNGYEVVLQDDVSAFCLSQGDFELGDPNTKFGQLFQKGVEQLAQQPGIYLWKQKAARAITGGLSAQMIWLADSILEGFSSTRRGNRVIDQVNRRLNGARPGSTGLLAPTAGMFGLTGDANWPGGDDPWTFTGSVTGNLTYGLAKHAANIPSGGGSASFSYFGDRFNIFYVRTATGPTACAVTLDGVAQSTFNANGATLPGQVVTYGTAGSYGFHTVVITPNSGTLILECVEGMDTDLPSIFLQNTFMMRDGSHGGADCTFWTGDDNWHAMFTGAGTYAGLTIIALGVNDDNARTAQQFEDDLVTIAGKMDTRMGDTSMSYLFLMVPGTQQAWVDAANRAVDRIGVLRAAVFDAGVLRPDRQWGSELSGDGIHGNDAGQAWLVEALVQVLDPTGRTAGPPRPGKLQLITATTEPTFRNGWTASLTAIAGSSHIYDQSPGGTTQVERVDRVWLDAGDHKCTLVYHADAALGSIQALLGRVNGATPELVSLQAAIATAAGGPAITPVRLSGTVTTHVSGFVPFVVRKTTASGAVRFVEAKLEKVA